MDHDEPLFREMEMEELDYGPSWGLLIFLVALGFAAFLVIIVMV